MTRIQPLTVNTHTVDTKKEPELPPDRIVENFRDDCPNIVKYASQIENLIRKQAQSSVNASEIESLENARLTGTIVERKYAEMRLAELMASNDSNASDARLDSYIRRRDAIMSRYKPSKRIVDINMKKRVYEPTPDDLERIAVIREFFALASEYVPVVYSCTGEVPANMSQLCNECYANLVDYYPGVTGVVTCPQCNAQCHIIETGRRARTTNDAPRSAEDLATFIEAIDYYEGKFDTKYNLDEITEHLDVYFSRENAPTSKQALALQCNEWGEKPGTSIKQLTTAMKECGYKCYNCANYIAHIYWGWRLPEISEIRVDLIEDFKATQLVWDKMTREQRGSKSNMPSRLRLYLHLRVRGYNCRIDSFKLPRDVSKYIEAFKYMCRNSGVEALSKVGSVNFL